jgi:hypothetical protein
MSKYPQNSPSTGEDKYVNINVIGHLISHDKNQNNVNIKENYLIIPIREYFTNEWTFALVIKNTRYNQSQERPFHK